MGEQLNKAFTVDVTDDLATVVAVRPPNPIELQKIEVIYLLIVRIYN